MIRRTSWLVLFSPCLLVVSASADTLALAGPQVQTTGSAEAHLDNGQLRLTINDPTGDAGLRLLPPDGQAIWDLSTWKYLAIDIENLSVDRQSRLVMHLSSGGSEKQRSHETNLGIALNPGEKRTMRLLLPHQWKYAAPEGIPGVRTLDTAHINKFTFDVQWPFEPAQKGLVDCRLTNLRVEEALTPTAAMSPEQYAPFIDEYGQFVHAQWPDKVHSAAELRETHLKEKQELELCSPPAEWDRFGGWKSGPQLQATGSFRTEKYEGKWYFIDPDGKLFFSHGLDVISKYNDPLKVMPGRENWFQKLPDGAKAYLPTEVSLRQKYGTEDYAASYFDTVSQRLVNWGFNSIGNWSSPDLMLLGRAPYALQLTDYDWKMPRLGASKLKFYDVFDPAYIRKMTSLIQDQAAKSPAVLKSLTDPMCIGYFIDNELDFGNRGKLALVDEILKCPQRQAAKQELINDLRQRYVTIEALNSAWETHHADWDALLASTSVPPQGHAYKVDSRHFLAKAIDQYFRLAREAVKSVAPHRLYLGCRFISTDAVRPALYEASKAYCDVLTVNIYSHSAANFPAVGFPDMPVLIGEFHFGLLDRGMFSPSLCQAGLTQDDRALAYTRFMQGVLVHPNFVGAHWFQYRDQPLTGRGDGEAYQIGFVDVTDTPYPEMCRAARSVGENMYRYRVEGKLHNTMTAGH
jgi:hypothetical protein